MSALWTFGFSGFFCWWLTVVYTRVWPTPTEFFFIGLALILPWIITIAVIGARWLVAGFRTAP